MISRLYPKLYTRKEWNRFTWEIQEELCKKYSIFLIEKKDGKILPSEQSFKAFLQQPNKDKAVQIIRNLNKKNLDKGIEIIHKSTDQISKFANKITFVEGRNFK